MHRSTILVAVLLLLVTPAAGAQTPAPPAATASGGVLVEMTLEALPSGSVATVGMVRTIYEVGGSRRVAAGSGPAVEFVETGAVVVRMDGGPEASVVAGGAGSPATPSVSDGTEITVEAGSAILIPPGATVEMWNPGEGPATTLNLLAATDAATEAEAGVAHAVLVQQDIELPDPPVTVTLSQVSVEPGAQLELPADAAHVSYASVERGQAFLLSGQGINRGAEPMDAYVLAILPGATAVA